MRTPGAPGSVPIADPFSTGECDRRSRSPFPGDSASQSAVDGIMRSEHAAPTSASLRLAVLGGSSSFAVRACRELGIGANRAETFPSVRQTPSCERLSSLVSTSLTPPAFEGRPSCAGLQAQRRAKRLTVRDLLRRAEPNVRTRSLRPSATAESEACHRGRFAITR